nr:MAG TPA: hypothetical protein [Caudoviricetes sp.]
MGSPPVCGMRRLRSVISSWMCHLARSRRMVLRCARRLMSRCFCRRRLRWRLRISSRLRTPGLVLGLSAFLRAWVGVSRMRLRVPRSVLRSNLRFAVAKDTHNEIEDE